MGTRLLLTVLLVPHPHGLMWIEHDTASSKNLEFKTLTSTDTHIPTQLTSPLLSEPAQQVVCCLLQQHVIVALIGQVGVIVGTQSTQLVNCNDWEKCMRNNRKKLSTAQDHCSLHGGLCVLVTISSSLEGHTYRRLEEL